MANNGFEISAVSASKSDDVVSLSFRVRYVLTGTKSNSPVVEATFPSGFDVDPDSLPEMGVNHVKRIDVDNASIRVYFDYLDDGGVSVSFRARQFARVRDVSGTIKDLSGTIKAYDFDDSEKVSEVSYSVVGG